MRQGLIFFTMPKIDKIFTLEITPERFVEACSEIELNEVFLLSAARLRRLEAALEIQEDGTVKTYSRDAKNNIVVAGISADMKEITRVNSCVQKFQNDKK